jgi:hypothetical protein
MSPALGTTPDPRANPMCMIAVDNGKRPGQLAMPRSRSAVTSAGENPA